MFDHIGTTKYDRVFPSPEAQGTEDKEMPLSSNDTIKSKATVRPSRYFASLSAIFRPKKVISSYQEEKKLINNHLLGSCDSKKKPSLASMSSDSTDTNITSLDSFYSTDSNDHTDPRFLLIGKETDSNSLKQSTSKELDEQTIKKKYPKIYQEFRNAGSNPQRLCAFLAHFDVINPVFEKNEEISSSLINFFTQQTLKNLGIDSSKNPTMFQFATQVAKVLIDQRKRQSALVLGRLQQTAFDLLEKENLSTKESPVTPTAIAFLKFISETDTLDL